VLVNFLPPRPAPPPLAIVVLFFRAISDRSVASENTLRLYSRRESVPREDVKRPSPRTAAPRRHGDDSSSGKRGWIVGAIKMYLSRVMFRRWGGGARSQARLNS
jgi:hypothetical protein